MKIKRALICDGGGMQGSFMAGVMKEFQDQKLDISFWDLLVGTSAGGFCCAYFATGQLEQGMRIWQKHLPHGFISTKHFHPYYDLSYLRKILTELEPLDLNKLRKLKTKIVVTLSKPGRKHPIFVDLRTCKDPIEVLLASASAPFLSENIKLDKDVYYDGGFTSQPPIKYPGLAKFNKKVVLLTYPRGFRFKIWTWKLSSIIFLNNSKLRRMVSETAEIGDKILDELEKDSSFMVLQPKKELPGKWLEKNPIMIKKNIKQGMAAARKFILKEKSLLTT
jgi:predicted patatin/cPLA2 family phospholipase